MSAFQQPAIREQVLHLPFSKIREVSRLGMTLPDVLPLWFGEPDVPTPDFIREAAKQALDQGETFYQPNAGLPALRQELATYLNRLYGSHYTDRNIVVTGSGMNALMVAAQALVAPGDRVVTTTPSWPNLPAVQEILSAEVVSVPLQWNAGRWSLDLEAFLDACVSARVILLNSPNNPTGWTMPAEQQQAVLAFARERGIWIVADEVYARMVYDATAAPSFCEWTTPEDSVLVVNSFSKSWAMTGWRLGWLTGPERLTETLEKLMEFNIAGPPGFVQQAGRAALAHGEAFIAESVGRYEASRDLLMGHLDQWPGVSWDLPEAAFYAFLKVEGLTDGVQLAKDLLHQAQVGLAPGEAFGPEGSGFLRACFAVSPERMAEALTRLDRVFAQPSRL